MPIRPTQNEAQSVQDLFQHQITFRDVYDLLNVTYDTLLSQQVIHQELRLTATYLNRLRLLDSFSVF